MVKITQRKLERLLFMTASCEFIGLTAITVPDMKKKGNPHWDRTVKIARVNGVINWRYSSAVNKQLLREGKPDAFKAYPRTWGQRVNYTPLVVNITDDGETHFYLEVKRERIDAGYFDTETAERVPESELKKWLKPDQESRQGTDKEIILRDYRLDHILELRMQREEYRIVPEWHQLNTYLPPAAEPPKQLELFP